MHGNGIFSAGHPMTPTYFQPRLFLAALAGALPPLVGLALGAPDATQKMIGGGAFCITLAGGWILSRLLAERMAKETKEAFEESKGPDYGPALKTLKEKLAQALPPLAEETKRLTKLTDDHEEKAEVTTSAAARATESATAIASATNEMTSAIEEIERQSEDASQIAAQAVEKTSSADQAVKTLAGHTDKIITMVELIRAVAQKTNLLALNASIEAARAGEHGRGFAVVAQEVKALAKQTAEATAKIDEQMSDVRMASGQAREAMQGVQEIIQKINDVALTIKGALQQETTATHEIANCAETTTLETNKVTDGVSHLLVTTEEIRTVCEAVAEKTKNLSATPD